MLKKTFSSLFVIVMVGVLGFTTYNISQADTAQASETTSGFYTDHITAIATIINNETQRLAQEKLDTELQRRNNLLTTEKERATVSIDEGKELIANTEGRVMDETTRDALFAFVTDKEALVPVSKDVNAVRVITVLYIPLKTAVIDSHNAWNIEEERKAEEARLAEEARIAEEARVAEETRKAEEARKAAEASRTTKPKNTSNNSSNGSTEQNKPVPAPPVSSSAPSDDAPAPASPPLAPPAQDNSMDAKAKSVLSQYGCGNQTIIWDDPRLGSRNGAASYWTGEILLNSSMPASRLSYVVAHECAHVLQYRAYGSTKSGWDTMKARMNEIYGTSGITGVEQNADCMTKAWGFSTYHYTNSCDGERGSAAQAIINGSRA